MIEWIGSTISAVRNAGPSIYSAALLATLLLLFLPDDIILRLGLIEFRQTNRTYAGLILIGSGSLLTVSAMSAAVRPLRVYWQTRKLERTGLQALRELTEDEKDFLRPYLRGENTRYASIADGVAKGLEAKTIVYRASQLSVPGGSFPFNLQPYIRRMLNAAPHLLD